MTIHGPTPGQRARVSCDTSDPAALVVWYTRSMSDDAPRGPIHATDGAADVTACGRKVDGPRWYIGRPAQAPVTCKRCVAAGAEGGGA